MFSHPSTHLSDLLALETITHCAVRIKHLSTVHAFQLRPHGEGSEVTGWSSRTGTLKKSKRVFGIIAKSWNYFLIIALLWLRDGVLRNVLSLSWLWCKHMWAEAHYREKLHLDCTTETALSARHAKTTIRLPKRGNVPYTAAFKTQIRQTTQLKLLTVLNPARLFSHPVHTK